MNRAPRIFIRLLAAAWLLVNLSSCGVVVVGGAAAAGTAAFVSGELSATLEAALADTVQATDRAIEGNRITLVSRTVSEATAAYVLRTTQGDRVDISLAEASDSLTEISIRVGVFGDEPLSTRILEEIEAHLD